MRWGRGSEGGGGVLKIIGGKWEGQMRDLKWEGSKSKEDLRVRGGDRVGQGKVISEEERKEKGESGK